MQDPQTEMSQVYINIKTLMKQTFHSCLHAVKKNSSEFVLGLEKFDLRKKKWKKNDIEYVLIDTCICISLILNVLIDICISLILNL